MLITGYRAETCGLIEGALRDGADAVCYKPLDMNSLFGVIGRAAADPAARGGDGG